MKAISTLLAASLAAAALAASGSAADRYVPFVTDFPSSTPDAPPTRVTAPVTDGFDWRDAAFGAAAGFALGALVPASRLVLRRQTGVSTA